MSFDSAKSDWSGTASGGDDSSVSKLPDDLQILAEQLSGDAQFLAERYPATAAAERFAKAVEMQIAASQTAKAGCCRRASCDWERRYGCYS